MKSYKLNINLIIVFVSILSIVIFSLVLTLSHLADRELIKEMLLHYGYIIAPVSIIWILTERYLWHTKLFQSLGSPLNIPHDLRGRWEGTLENADGSEPQKFVIEVKQTLTTLRVQSFSSIGQSSSILSEIATSANEDKFTLCYLWQGEIHTSIKEINLNEFFYGYTMLHLHEKETPKILKGAYFTNRKSSQTRGGIQLNWVSYKRTKKLE